MGTRLSAVVLSPSFPMALLPAQPAGQPGPATNSSQSPRARVAGKAGSGQFRRQCWLTVCVSRGPIPLTPTQRSVICAQPAGVSIAGRDCSKGVAARDRVGDKALSVGGVAQTPVGIQTCTTRRPARPRHQLQSVALRTWRGRGGQRAHLKAAPAGGVWQPRSYTTHPNTAQCYLCAARRCERRRPRSV